ncbi:hypothetical protein WP50_11485 [Lactiplantibacillus plantarum]|nr:hypothetical protein WP50_11485 [Lactiplantibacillus plantarum]
MNNDVLDQTLLQNIEAEKAVRGAIFLNSDALVEAMEFVEAQDFYRRAHQIIFASMVTLNDRDEAIDAVTVSDLLTAQNQLDDVGGMSYIAELGSQMNNDVLDQTPPQNIEAEKAVLGAIFLNSDALVEAMEFVEAQDFYRRAHQIIFASMVTLNDRDEAIDAVTVSDLLTAQNQLDDVGGMSYIAELAGK